MNITDSAASQFVRIALGHVTREFPNKLDHVLDGPADAASPRALHPMFYGSFDWHSCVHGHWLLAHCHRRWPHLPESDRIRDLFDRHFTDANVAAELAYLARPSSRGFERPYGWAWLLKLAAELAQHTTEEGTRWARMLQPLAEAFSARFCEHLPQATYPIRSGTHSSSAFAFVLALDYAGVRGDAKLAACIRERAQAWYAEDRDCQAWEPGGDDFLSPALVEALCMQRTLGTEAFSPWLAAFLPRLAEGRPTTLFEPAIVGSRSDGKLVHLDGLNLSRAWCFRELAVALPETDTRRTVLRDAANAHLAASLPHVAGDYAGEHWLATYALLALAAP